MDGGVGYVDMDALKATELRLGLPGSDPPEKLPPTTTTTARPTKRSLDEDRAARREPSEGGRATSTRATKAQVVGWPPIRSYRKNSFQAMKAAAEAAGLYVKVSMDGAPYLRKIDLAVFKGTRNSERRWRTCSSASKVAKDPSTPSPMKTKTET
ncbi:unnamed protein product [Musa textilis]